MQGRCSPERSIPARAGEPDGCGWVGTVVWRRVYPRACGGTAAGSVPSPGGSIPARAGEPNVNAMASTRSIPARAGEPRPFVLSPICGGSVPGRSIPARAGEPACINTAARRGLSPRVRGNRGRPVRSTGSIPARAGEPRTIDWVYPRACGGTRPAASKMAVGSIPARAGEPELCISPQPTRSIPARAGEPWRAPELQGLSPRVRGEPGTSLAMGSIPARAGEPRGRSGAGVATSGGLSPRVRGNRPPGLDLGMYGLSPRVRGNRQSRGQRPVYPRACGGTSTFRPRERSIPARAGEPDFTSRRQGGLSPRAR